MCAKVLILSGSPRKNGNTEILCDRFAEGVRDAGHHVELVRVCDKDIHYCTGCDSCVKSGRCVFRDDMEEIRDRMAKVVETEAPIREALLYKRVINSLSMKKVGSRIEPVFRRIALSLPYERTEENGEMVFHDGPEDFFRTSIGSDRYSYQIPIAEAAA